MKLFYVALLSFPGLLLATTAFASDPSPRDLHSAQCVAALEANTEELAKQVKAGNEAQRQLLMDRMVAGAAFVGDSYLNGSSDEQQAKALTNQALEAQKKLPAPDLAARQTACADEGTKLYAASNGLQQNIVKRLAKKRMNKLLGA